MEISDFLSTHLKEVLNNCKTAINANWLKVCLLCFEKGKPFSIKFKHIFNELADFCEFGLKQHEEQGKRRRINAKLLSHCPVSVSKKNDMTELLKYTPLVHHGYLRTFPVALGTRSSDASNPLNEA